MASGGNSPFMAGVPEMMLLRLLKDQEMYGYELAEAIAVQSKQVIALGEGVLYPVLHELERNGALKSRRKTVNGRSRVYYTITSKGERRLKDLASTWATLNGVIQDILRGGAHAI